MKVEEFIAGNSPKSNFSYLVGMAKAGRPITGASAERVPGEPLGRVLAVNDRPGLAYGVESMVVFGSYLSKAERLNDLDIPVELKAKRDDDASFALRGR